MLQQETYGVGTPAQHIEHREPNRPGATLTLDTCSPPWEERAPFMTDLPERPRGTILDPKKARDADAS